jgi:predicted PurR-regulated permease PerM
LNLPRALSIALTYIIFYGLIIATLSAIVPPFITQVEILARQIQIPQSIISSLDLNTINLQDLDVIAGQFTSVPKILSIIFSAFSVVLVIFTISVITFYLLIERKNLHHSLTWFFGDGQAEAKAESFVNQIESQIGGWVRGESALMFIVGLLTYIGLKLLGINYALPLAIIAGILEILPNIGPTISAVPAIAVAYFSVSPTMALAVTALYVLVQQLENNFIVPMVMKQSVGLNPLITIVTLLVGFRLGGAIGAVLSIPIFLVLKVVVTEIYRIQQEKRANTIEKA